MSRRILETLTYLARNHPYVAKILLQFRLPLPALGEPENTDQARGKAVMVVERETDGKLHQEGYISIALLLSLLNQPLYLRSIAHLEQVMVCIVQCSGFFRLIHFSMYVGLSWRLFHTHFWFLLQLLNLLEVVINKAESKSSLSDKSGAAPEQPSAPQNSTSDTEINTEAGGAPSGVAVSSSTAVDSSKPTTSSANNEYDTQSVLLNLPQAELRLLCSLLAREGYDGTLGLQSRH